MSRPATDRCELFDILHEAKRLRWCCHCKHWDPADIPPTLDQHKERLIIYRGQCRRYPPTIHGDDERTIWPVTEFLDSCGEYALNKTPFLARYIEELAHAQPADEQP